VRDSEVVFLVPDLEPDVCPDGGAWDFVPPLGQLSSFSPFGTKSDKSLPDTRPYPKGSLIGHRKC
jgi:hypothetical protein